LAFDKTLIFVDDFFSLVFMLNFGISSLNANVVPYYHQRLTPTSTGFRNWPKAVPLATVTSSA
jgi:hypothetical protein